jgi:uncharacterized GH25 family protein
MLYCRVCPKVAADNGELDFLNVRAKIWDAKATHMSGKVQKTLGEA